MSHGLLAAAGIRSFVTGLTGVLFGLYLAQRGAGAEAVGLLVGAGLAGIAVGTMIVAYAGERLGRRRVLVATTLLSAGGLATVALAASVPLLALAGFLGMVNGMGRDRGAAQALEQSLLADAATDGTRTRLFTRYVLVQDICGALGALAVGVSGILEHAFTLDPVMASRVTLLGAAVVGLAPLALYLRLAPDGAMGGDGSWWRAPLSPGARRRVGRLSALFALDSLGGGFLAGSILTYWFFRRFGLGGEVLGPVFFAARGLNAASYLGAVWLADRIGLVRTMVFTHLPSSVLLCALPFVPGAAPAVALFLVREALVQMDVPTRQSYVAAVTAPGERTFALGVTGVIRNVGWAFGPPLGGVAMSAFGLGAPLLLGAGLKIVYDLTLYGSFRDVRPPGENA